MYVGGEGKGGAAIKSKTATQKITKDDDCYYIPTLAATIHVRVRIHYKILILRRELFGNESYFLVSVTLISL